MASCTFLQQCDSFSGTRQCRYSAKRLFSRQVTSTTLPCPSRQTKANWALANLAATYADYIGKKGGIEAVTAGMTACAEAYQVQISGTRCLQNLIQTSPINTHRAKAAGAIALLRSSLEANPEDGQLQWRGNHLLQTLEAAPDAAPEVVAEAAESPVSPPAAGGAPATSISRNSPWGKAKAPELAALSRQASHEQVPGLHGASAVVAVEAQKGIAAVLELLRTRGVGDPDIAMWCFDAVATLITGEGRAPGTPAAPCAAAPPPPPPPSSGRRQRGEPRGGLPRGGHRPHRDLHGAAPVERGVLLQGVLGAARAGARLRCVAARGARGGAPRRARVPTPPRAPPPGPCAAKEIGAAGIIHHLIICMHHNKTEHDLQVRG